MLIVRCRCGREIRTDTSQIGHKVRCRCGQTLKIRAPRPPRKRFTPRALWRPNEWTKGRQRARSNAARWTDRVAWAYAALICLATLLLWTLGDRWWPATLLLFGHRWVLALPLIPLALAAALLHRRSLLPLALAVPILLGPLLGFRIGLGRLAAAAIELRLVSFNAQGGHWVDLPTVLLELKPDVLALQECRVLREQFDDLPGWHADAQGDTCLLSRFPIRSSDLLSGWNVGQLGFSGEVVRYTLEAPGGAFHLTNLHLDTPRRGLEPLLAGGGGAPLETNTRLREIASQRAARWIAEDSLPFLAAGDFNMPVESALYRSHWSGFRNAFSSVGFGFGFTKREGRIGVRIDHVLLGPKWRTARAFVGRNYGSDHQPMVVDLGRER